MKIMESELVLLVAARALKEGNGEFHISVKPADNHVSSCHMTGSGSVNGMLRATHAFICTIDNIKAQEEQGMDYEDVLKVLSAMHRLSDHSIIGTCTNREEGKS